MSTPARSAPGQAQPAANHSQDRASWVSLGLVAIWVLLMSRFGDADVYSVMGPYACVVTLTCLALSARETLAAFSCSVRSALLGSVVGAAMTLLTYPAFSLAAQIIPGLTAQVAGLYQFASTTSAGKALLWVATLVVAEEVLFRQTLPRALQRWAAERTAFMLAIALYAGAQLGSGSWIVFLLALACGAIWTALRIYTGSITPSLIAHGIWTPTVIVLLPVT